MENKILGIIGGMGPLATAQLYELITLHTKVKKEQDHIHIIIDSVPQIPDRTDHILNGTENPGPKIRESTKRLMDAGADYIIMPCNTAHFFKDYITEVAGNRFIDMIDVTANYIEDHYQDVDTLVLMATKGVYQGMVYKNIFHKHHLNILVPTESEQAIIMKLIYSIKLGKTEFLDDYNDILDNYIKKGYKHFITGCTELSVANERFNLHGYQIDPLMCLTEFIIETFDKEFVTY